MSEVAEFVITCVIITVVLVLGIKANTTNGTTGYVDNFTLRETQYWGGWCRWCGRC
jgi:hypothetical protein